MFSGKQTQQHTLEEWIEAPAPKEESLFDEKDEPRIYVEEIELEEVPLVDKVETIEPVSNTPAQTTALIPNKNVFFPVAKTKEIVQVIEESPIASCNPFKSCF